MLDSLCRALVWHKKGVRIKEMRLSSFRWLSLATVVMSSSAFGQRTFYDVNPNRISVVQADFVRPIDANNRPIGPWVALPKNPVEREAPSWQVAFDSMNVNPTTFATFSGFYGASTSPAHRGNTFKIFMNANDATFATPSRGKFAKRALVGLIWNPGGTAVRSGTADCIIRIKTATFFDLSGNGPAVSSKLSGVEVLKTNLTSTNPQVIDANFGTVTGGVPIPRGSGAITLEIGTTDTSGNFETLVGNFAAQPMLCNMVSPGEPQFPGTNPSSSGEFVWDDDTDPNFPFGTNAPNYNFEDFTNTASTSIPYAEQYSNNAVFENKGILQPCTSLFFDANGTTISGSVLFQALSNPLRQPETVTFNIFDVATQNLVDTQTVEITSAGSYTLSEPKPLTGGNYIVKAKSSHWLQQSAAVDTRGSGAPLNRTDVNFSLINGDVDGNNGIDLADYLVLVGYFDKTVSDSDWLTVDGSGVAPIDADLDGNDVVDLSDYLILVANFDQVGS